ncbi:hypothetical protein [Amylibacter sp. SFDW26]|uniref:hypothetical protein n=1 Tax=Amylibacter sp. SFDW26 TaxID=2652722 RepID=UPI00186A5EF3|nr:hypothetical protein [Amylibacter sp. SFDW26]
MNQKSFLIQTLNSVPQVLTLDTQYKGLGNFMAVPIIAWIMDSIRNELEQV